MSISFCAFVPKNNSEICILLECTFSDHFRPASATGLWTGSGGTGIVNSWQLLTILKRCWLTGDVTCQRQHQSIIVNHSSYLLSIHNHCCQLLTDTVNTVNNWQWFSIIDNNDCEYLTVFVNNWQSLLSNCVNNWLLSVSIIDSQLLTHFDHNDCQLLTNIDDYWQLLTVLTMIDSLTIFVNHWQATPVKYSQSLFSIIDRYCQ